MNKKYILIGLAMAFCLVIFISPFASKSPDGLERVAKDKGFIEKGDIKQIVPSPLPDYVCPWIKNEKITTIIAGLIGILVVFFVGLTIALLLKNKNNSK